MDFRGRHDLTEQHRKHDLFEVSQPDATQRFISRGRCHPKSVSSRRHDARSKHREGATGDQVEEAAMDWGSEEGAISLHDQAGTNISRMKEAATRSRPQAGARPAILKMLPQ